MSPSSEVPIFTCPECNAKQPFKYSWMLTRYSEFSCSKCQTSLIPLAQSVPRIHAFSGLAGGFIGILFYKDLGFATALIVVPLVLLFNCWVSFLSVKFQKKVSY